MNINYKEPQFELFPANSASLEDINKPKFLLASLTLSTESLVILVILAIMIALFSFSIGVERGKHLAAQAMDEKVSAAWGVGKNRAAVAPVAAVSTATANPPNSVIEKTLHQAPAVHSVAKTATASVGAQTMMAPAKSVAVPAAAKWTLQVATYRGEKYAQQEALALKAKGFPVFIIKFKEFYLVCVGQFATQSQADAYLKRLPAKNKGSQVRRI